MDAQLVGSFTHGDYKADVYSMEVPGEFKVVYINDKGETLEEAPLTGISTYKQREPEIQSRLQELADGAKPESTPERGDAGEY